MPKVTNVRKYCKSNTHIRQSFMTDFYKAPSYFLPTAENITKRIQTRQISLIKEYDKKIHLPKEKEFRKQMKKEKGLLPEHRKYWNGYMFFTTNNFSEYFVITMFAKTDNIKIFKAGTQVATASVDADSALTHIAVDEPFRRQKIGSELIRFISQRAQQFTVFGGTEFNSSYRLSEEGGKLVTHCVRKGILKTEQVVMSCPPSPSISI